MILSRIIKRITKITKFEVKNFTTVVLNRLVLFNVLDIETTTPIYYS